MPTSQPSSPVAVTIGNFDGVHLGHAALVAAARAAVDRRSPDEEAGSRRREKGRVAVLCFDPHPLTVLRPDAVPPQLSTFEQRRQWLMRAGADAVEPLRPTKEFLAQSPEQFVEWMVEKHRPIAVVEGMDFRFGRGRAGSFETLRMLGERYGFETIVVDPVEVALADQSMVRAASSTVRWLVAHGRARDARRVLGRPFELRGEVVRGDQRGRAIGVPTANLALQSNDILLPADGIYAGLATAPDGGVHPAAISVGTKPTFGKSPRTCEAHLLDYDGPSSSAGEYGWTMRVEFHEWIRDQSKYHAIEPLVEQIRRDLATTRRIIRTSCRVALDV